MDIGKRGAPVKALDFSLEGATIREGDEDGGGDAGVALLLRNHARYHMRIREDGAVWGDDAA